MKRNSFRVVDTLMTPRKKKAGKAQKSIGAAQQWERIQELLLTIKDQITRLTLWPFLKP